MQSFWAAAGQVTEETDVFGSEGSGRNSNSDCGFITDFISSHVEHLRDIFYFNEDFSMTEYLSEGEDTLFSFWGKL